MYDAFTDYETVESLERYARGTTYFRAPGHDEPFRFEGMAIFDEGYIAIGLSLDGTRSAQFPPERVTFMYAPL